MRRKLLGVSASILLVAAVSGLAAPPAFATDYFVKYLNTVPSTLPLCDPQSPSGPRHGSVVFRRTSTSMFATVYVRGAPPNAGFTATLTGHSASCEQKQASGTTDGQGNATVHVGPEARKGKKAFYVHVTTVGAHAYETGDVPAFGF
jgi:hypothetical protein